MFLLKLKVYQTLDRTNLFSKSYKTFILFKIQSISVIIALMIITVYGWSIDVNLLRLLVLVITGVSVGVVVLSNILSNKSRSSTNVAIIPTNISINFNLKFIEMVQSIWTILKKLVRYLNLKPENRGVYVFVFMWVVTAGLLVMNFCYENLRLLETIYVALSFLILIKSLSAGQYETIWTKVWMPMLVIFKLFLIVMLFVGGLFSMAITCNIIYITKGSMVLLAIGWLLRITVSFKSILLELINHKYFFVMVFLLIIIITAAVIPS